MNEIATIKPALTIDIGGGFDAREFMQIVETGAFEGKVELVDGVIVKVPPPGLKHSLLNASVAYSLVTVLAGHRLTVAVDLAIQIDDRKLRGIDIALVKDGAPETGVAEGRHVELAVEISDSSLTTDLGAKAQEYAEAGIPHYWVVDVNARVVHVMDNLQSGRYASRNVVRFGESLTVADSGEVIVVMEPNRTATS